jgi:type IV secretory pathway VirB10-like protein
MTCSKYLVASVMLMATAAAAQGPAADYLLRAKGGKTDAPADWAGVTQKTPSKTNYFLPTGYTFPVRLENAVYSYNAETPAIAVVEKDVIYLRRVVIPADTRVIGTVGVVKSHDRVLITFHTLVFKTGDEVKFSGMALSLDGSAGVKGKVETHKDSSVANTVMSSFLSGAQTALTVSGISPIAAGATSGLAQEANKTLETQRQEVTESISIDAETGLRVYIPQRLEY